MKINKTFRDWFLDSLKKEKEEVDYKHPLEIRIKQRDWEWASICSLVSFYGVIFFSTFMKEYFSKNVVQIVTIMGFVGSMILFLYCASKVDFYREFYIKFDAEFAEKQEK